MAWIKIAFDDQCHVTYAVRVRGGQRWFHAIGDGPAGNCVTEDLARMRFDKSRRFTPWIPILFAARATQTGHRSRNCATAAARALARGWFWLP